MKKKESNKKVIGILPVKVQAVLQDGSYRTIGPSVGDFGYKFLVNAIEESPMKTVYNLPVYRIFHFCPVKQNIADEYLFLSAITFPSDEKNEFMAESIVSRYIGATASLPLPLNRLSPIRLFVYPGLYKELSDPFSYEGDYDLIDVFKDEYDFGNQCDLLMKKEGKQLNKRKFDLRDTSFKSESEFTQFINDRDERRKKAEEEIRKNAKKY